MLDQLPEALYMGLATNVHTSAGLAPIATSVSEVLSAPTTPSVPVHHMVTRNIDGQRKVFSVTRHPIRALTVITSAAEPTCFSVAIKSPDWRAAMALEFDALQHNGTWSLVPPHPSMNIVGCKWVYIYIYI